MKIPSIDITKLKQKCWLVVAEAKKIGEHVITITHTCEGDKDHELETCVCKCGFYWSNKQTKETIVIIENMGG